MAATVKHTTPRQSSPPGPTSNAAVGAPTSGSSRFGSSGTPLQLRLLSIVCVAAVLVTSVFAWFQTDRLVEESATIRDSTGEVLIANQEILASLAEADTAAAAVHLAGADGDQVQRRVYELALERVGSKLEFIAASLGDDPESHLALQKVGASLTRYSGEVEAARLASIEGLPDANERLANAISTVRSDITPELQRVTTRAEERFIADIESRWYLGAANAFLLPVVLLLLAQFLLFRRFRRLINLPLAAATIILLGLSLWMWSSWSAQQSSLDEAQTQAYNAIATSAEIQQLAFTHRAEVTEAVIAGSDVPDSLPSMEADLDVLIGDAISNSDTDRERAAAESMRTRYERYLAANNDLLVAVASGDADSARLAVRGDSNDAFTGLNTSIEAALFDNRNQFKSNVTAAGNALANLRLALFVGAALAALLTWAGFSLRIREYR